MQGNKTKYTVNTPENVSITPRNPSFDFSDVEKVWMKDPITSHFMNALSIFIPFSERTVSEVLRNNINNVNHPELKQQIKGMIKQEGRHAAMHRRSNEKIKQCYGGLTVIENIQKRTMKIIRTLSSSKFEMCIPASFEHFTSAVSHDILRNQIQWTGKKNNTSIDFVLWHCLEELEHQAIGRDAYFALNNSHLRLLFSQMLWVPLTMISIYGTQLYLLHKDRIIYRPKNWVPYLRFVIRSGRLFFKGGFDMCRTGYNPWTESDQRLYHQSLSTYQSRTFPLQKEHN